MVEKYKLHNVRLDDEVWAAVKALNCSLNQYLRNALINNDPITAPDNGEMIATPAAHELVVELDGDGNR